MSETDESALYTRASNAELIEAGYDPTWIAPHDSEGPYVTVRVTDAVCGCCGHAVLGWTVVNLETAVGASITWTHDDGETEADEHASALNGAWLAGRRRRGPSDAEMFDPAVHSIDDDDDDGL